MMKQLNVVHMDAYTQERVFSPRSREEAEDARVSLQDVQLMAQILGIAQLLCEEGLEGIARLCNEIKYLTQERASLLLGRRIKKVPSATCLSISVQFGQSIYGTLCVTSDFLHPERPALSLPIAQLLAQVCGWLLHTFEQSIFLQGQCKKLEYYVHGPLTRREHEVLSLICRGYNRGQIADELCIAPATVGKHLQHIYEQLGVHSEHDALLAAYVTGIFSPVGQSEMTEQNAR